MNPRSRLIHGLRPEMQGSTESEVRAKIAHLRRAGWSVMDIARAVYVDDSDTASDVAIGRVQQALKELPRRFRFHSSDLVSGASETMPAFGGRHAECL